MADKIKEIHSGTMGWFWPGGSRTKSVHRDPDSGYLTLGDDGLLHLTTLVDADPKNLNDSRIPSLITGATESGGVMILDITGKGGTSRFGGSSASVSRYRARSIISGVNLKTVVSDRLREISAHFFGISGWLGMTTVRETIEHHTGSSLLKSWTIKVDSAAEDCEKLARGRELAITSHWKVDGEEDRRQVHAPVSIACRSLRPTHLRELLYPLLRIQELVSMAYGGFVAAGGGLAVPDTQEASHENSAFWDSDLMRPQRGVVVPETLNPPYFRCSDIDGVAGLKRWIALCERHPRAVRPLVERYRYGKSSAPLRLMEVAAGIEYWVAAHRRSAKWANRRHGGKHRCGNAWTLASYVGRDFGDWVGDPHAWAEAFWASYNRVKHDPADSPQEHEMHVLAETGYLLLAAAILNRVACKKAPTTAIFEGSKHRTWQLQKATHELLSGSTPTA